MMRWISRVRRGARPGLVIGLLLCLVAAFPAVSGAQANQERKPLLIEGKKTLFQRVITHPGARLLAGPEPKAQVVLDQLPPFTVFYVYGRKKVGDKVWVEVGPSTSDGAEGWLEGERVSDWRQSLTLVFTERTGRGPVLFFKDRDSLEKVAARSSSGRSARELITEFEAIQKGREVEPENYPVVAMEPAEEAVSRERFYLIPIFKHLEPLEGIKFLEVASVDPGTAGGEAGPAVALPSPQAGAKQGNGAEELRTGIVFVIDTTISMRPYIQRTREAVRRLYDSVEEAGLADKVAFGLVAYRSSIEKTPELGYVAKVISDLKDARQRQEFEAALAKVDEARVSSHSFNEDAFAGLKTALQDLDWKPYQSRLIMLITDAGAIRNDDPYSTTGMNEAEVADLAAAKGVKIFALHLRTPAGGPAKFDNHASAEAQYRILTKHSDKSLGDLYVPIDAGRAEAGVKGFGRAVEGVAKVMVNLVQATSTGQRLVLPEEKPGQTGDVVEEATRKAAILGYAMQLDFLGRKGRVRSPQVVTSWVSDMDLASNDTPAFRVTVLLTKNQLSDLYERLKLILDQAQRTKRTGAKDFFQSILSAAALTARDPTKFTRKPNQNLQQLGLLGEFLDDLPYKSNIMRLTEEDWYRMSVGEQQTYVDDLKSKLRRYEDYHDDVANWESFGAENPGEAVYRVPLSMLP